MSEPSSYNIHEYHLEARKEIGRLEEQTAQTWRRECEYLSRLGVLRAERVLDAGSGTGGAARGLLRDLAVSRVTLLDLSRELLNQANDALRPFGDRAEFVNGSVYCIPIADETFDFVITRYLLQHLARPVAALKEMRRVLRCSGQVVVVDIDQDLCEVFEPDVPVYRNIARAKDVWQARRGGNRRVGRYLLRWLRNAGFSGCRLDTLLMHSDEIGLDTERILRQGDLERLGIFFHDGLLNARHVREAHSTQERFFGSDDSLVMFQLFIASGWAEDPASI